MHRRPKAAPLPPSRLLHALSLAYLAAVWMPRNAAWMRGRAAGALAAIGRNSLQVSCVGLFLSYGVALALRFAPSGACGWMSV